MSVHDNWTPLAVTPAENPVTSAGGIIGGATTVTVRLAAAEVKPMDDTATTVSV